MACALKASRSPKVCGGGKQYCVICHNHRGKIIDGRVVKLHSIPANKQLKRAWEQRLRLIRQDYNTVKHPLVCSEHFVGQRGPVFADDVPSVFPNRTFQLSTLNRGDKAHPAAEVEIAEPEVDAAQPLDSFEEQQNCLQGELSLPAFSLLLHDYAGPVDTSTIFKPTHLTQKVGPDTTVLDAAVQTEPFVCLGMPGSSVGTQTDFCSNYTPLKYEHVSQNEEVFRAYTGMPNAGTAKAVFEEVSKTEESSVRKCSLRLIDQFLMTLMRLRLGLVLTDLSFRFSIPKSTCSRIINKWVDILHVRLSSLIYWPTRGQINATMPSDVKERFPMTRVIIDCTELFTETPRSLAEQSLMYSHYKTHMTWKALVGVTPNGVVSFVSDLWAGSISDKQLVIKSGMLDLCEQGDAIMADKGFLISDLTTPRGMQMIMPPKKNKAKQMSVVDLVLTRRIANVRIHVERHMERVKNYRILNSLTGTMKANVSKVWRICNSLTTLLPPLHPHEYVDEDDPTVQ